MFLGSVGWEGAFLVKIQKLVVLHGLARGAVCLHFCRAVLGFLQTR